MEWTLSGTLHTIMIHLVHTSKLCTPVWYTGLVCLFISLYLFISHSKGRSKFGRYFLFAIVLIWMFQVWLHWLYGFTMDRWNIFAVYHLCNIHNNFYNIHNMFVFSTIGSIPLLFSLWASWAYVFFSFHRSSMLADIWCIFSYVCVDCILVYTSHPCPFIIPSLWFMSQPVSLHIYLCFSLFLWF